MPANEWMNINGQQDKINRYKRQQQQQQKKEIGKIHDKMDLNDSKFNSMLKWKLLT